MDKRVYINYEMTCKELVDTLIEMLFENEERDFEFWKEILCRKLLKWGYLIKEDDYYKTTGRGRTEKNVDILRGEDNEPKESN